MNYFQRELSSESELLLFNSCTNKVPKLKIRRADNDHAEHNIDIHIKRKTGLN